MKFMVRKLVGVYDLQPPPPHIKLTFTSCDVCKTILLECTRFPPTRIELNGNSDNLNERAKSLPFDNNKNNKNF